MTDAFWAGRRVLVTGHTGFKGAWLTLWLQLLGARVNGLALPPESDDGAFLSMAPWARLESNHADLRNSADVTSLMESFDPEVIFHLGAQALVRRGYAEPFNTYAVNVMGTLNVLHAARRAPSLRGVVVVTSDKVYAQGGGPFREGDLLGGDDPYSGSKALAELAVRSVRDIWPSDGPAIATARAGNVIGGGDQGQDRLLPDVWRAIKAGLPVTVRYPDAIRPWQFVLEPLHGYLLLAERLVTDPLGVPEALNFGPDASACRPVVQVLERVFELWGSGEWRVDTRTNPPEAHILRLDATLASTVLGWQPTLSLDEALAWTVEWWRTDANRRDLRRLAVSQISEYVARRPVAASR